MRGSPFWSNDIRDYLIGNAYGAIGLLHKVEQRVKEQDTIDGPVYKTGSVMLTGPSASRDHGNESGLSETCFELLVALTQWLGKGIGWDTSGDTEKQLLRYLIENRITDIEVLTGGRIQQVIDEVDRILPEDRELYEEHPAWQRVNELKKYLLDWLDDDCHHQWELIADVDNSLRVATYRCTVKDCNARKNLYNNDENEWVAV